MNIIQTNFQYRKPLVPLDLNNVNYIIVHHPSWKVASPEEIHADVLADPEKKSWSGFPYNEYIRKDGTVYIGRGDNIGAQCAGMNSSSYGISCEGDYDKELIMPQAQKEPLIERIRYNRARFPNYKMTGPHWQFGDTSCPGKNFPMAEILKRIEVINLTFDDAIKLLATEGVITNEEYRRKVCDVVDYEKEFVINVATKIQQLLNNK